MTLRSTGRRMRPHQRKSIVLVKRDNIIYQPTIAGVTSPAVLTNRIPMHISVATDTGGLCFIKHQAAVAIATIRLPVLTFQRKSGFIMGKYSPNLLSFQGHPRVATLRSPGPLITLLPKRIGNLPAVGSMTFCAVQFQTISMRILSDDIAKK